MKGKVTIKRYKNKKYYSLNHRKYLTIEEIIRIIKDDTVEVSIVDHEGNDIMRDTLRSALVKLDLSVELMTDLVVKYG